MSTSYPTPGQVQLVGELPAGNTNLLNQSFIVTNDDGTGSGGAAVNLGIRVWNGTNYVIATLRNTTTGGAGSVTLAGDVTGPSSGNTVVQLSGAAGSVVVLTNTISWSNLVLTPKITQSAPGTNVDGQSFTVLTQAGGAGGADRRSGALNLGTGAGNGAGLAGAVNIQWAGTTQFSFDPTFSGLLLSQPNLYWGGTVTAPLIQHLNAVGAGAGHNLTVQAQAATAGGGAAVGGNINLISGSGVTGGAPGVINFEWGGVGFAAAFDQAFNGLNMQTPNITWSASVNNPTIKHQQSSSTSGTQLTIEAQSSVATGVRAGGNIQLITGAGFGVGGTVGVLQLSFGGQGSAQFINIDPLDGIAFSPSFTTPTFQQQLTAGTAANMLISAQSTSAGSQGGHLRLRSGDGGTGPGLVQLFLGHTNSLPSLGIDQLGNHDIFTGTAPGGGSPVTVGTITSNNEVHIFLNEIITTPPPDVTGATVVAGIRCTINGLLPGFIPVILEV